MKIYVFINESSYILIENTYKKLGKCMNIGKLPVLLKSKNRKQWRVGLKTLEIISKLNSLPCYLSNIVCYIVITLHQSSAWNFNKHQKRRKQTEST